MVTVRISCILSDELVAKERYGALHIQVVKRSSEPVVYAGCYTQQHRRARRCNNQTVNLTEDQELVTHVIVELDAKSSDLIQLLGSRNNIPLVHRNDPVPPENLIVYDSR